MRIPLTGGAYQARSLIANTQRSLNLYPEKNGQGDNPPIPVTHYPAPGSRALATPPKAGRARGLYRCSNGRLFYMVGQTLYEIGVGWGFTSLGTVTTKAITPVSMADNGSTLVLVDGSQSGYSLDLLTAGAHLVPIVADAFYGADRVDFLDTFLLFNKPATPQFYASDSNAITFDSLYFANKTAYADLLVTIVALHREIWLIGQVTTEVWFNSGAEDFPFQSMPGAFVDQGCMAKYSVAKVDNNAFWLGQDQAGQAVVLKGAGYQAKRISTHALEYELSTYERTDDAVGFCYQQQGHPFYVLTFPTADKTWVFDLASDSWHERAWIDTDGEEHRIRAGCCAYAYGSNVVGDWENGTLYALDPALDTDNGHPMKFVRSFPHMVNDGSRIFYRKFIADMQVGSVVDASDPQVSLDWSDDRGRSWGNPIMLSLGKTGEGLVSMRAQRLGMARDRVFRLTWSSVGAPTALNGAWIDAREVTS